MFDFQEPFQSDYQPEATAFLDPSGKFIASISKEATIELQNILSKQIFSIINVPGPIEKMEWSPNGTFIAVLLKSKHSLFIYFSESNRKNEKQMTQAFTNILNQKLDLDGFRWAPNSQEILLFMGYSSQLYVWNINNKSLITLCPPKNSNESVMFSHKGHMLGVLHHEIGTDQLLLYSTDSYSLLTTFDLNTLDATSIKWSDDDTTIIIIDAPSNHMLIVINAQTYSIREHSAYEGFLGITSAVFSPNSKQIAVGGHDNIVRLLISPDWRVLFEFSHITTFQNPNMIIFFEKDGHMQIAKIPKRIRFTNNTGVYTIKFSPNSAYIATISKQASNAIYIWKTESISLERVLIFQSIIVQIDWEPTSGPHPSLFILTESGFSFFWTEEGVYDVPLPPDFHPLSFIWANDGSKLLFSGQNGLNIVSYYHKNINN